MKSNKSIKYWEPPTDRREGDRFFFFFPLKMNLAYIIKSSDCMGYIQSVAGIARNPQRIF